jgi:hypothetical protein
MRGRLGPNNDVHSIIHSRQLARLNADVDRVAVDAADAHRPEWEHEEAPSSRGGPSCDRDNDRSPSPDGLGPWAFGHRIQKAAFLPHFQSPTNITKYTGEANPAVWLEDFRLAYRAGGADDCFIIQYLPIYVREHV